jgi:ATP-binding cassette subfamily B protein
MNKFEKTIILKNFPHFKQLDAMDCGPSCIRIIAKHYGHPFSLKTLREKSFLTRQGVSLLGISEAAESIGFRTQGVKISFDQLVSDTPLPCILHWNQNHFVVCYDIKKKRSMFKQQQNDYSIYRLRKLTLYDFERSSPIQTKFEDVVFVK